MAYTAHKKGSKMAQEHYDPPDVLECKVNRLAALITESNHFVAFTGAGISTSAGISDFRGPLGKWTREAQGLAPVPSRTRAICAIPTPTHMALVALERHSLLKHLISQNCDGLHRRSSFAAAKLSELHGNCNIEACETCGARFLRDKSCRRVQRGRDHATGRTCPRRADDGADGACCGGRLLNTTIDFGQDLPTKPFRDAHAHAKQADLHLVLGSSLTVSPACDQPAITAKRGGALVIVNLQPTPLSEARGALHIFAKTDVVMTMVMERLGIEIPAFHLTRRVAIGCAPHANPAMRTLFVEGVDCDDAALPTDVIAGANWSVNPRSGFVAVVDPANGRPACRALGNGRWELDVVAAAVPIGARSARLLAGPTPPTPELRVALDFCGHYAEPTLLLEPPVRISTTASKLASSEVFLELALGGDEETASSVPRWRTRRLAPVEEAAAREQRARPWVVDSEYGEQHAEYCGAGRAC